MFCCSRSWGYIVLPHTVTSHGVGEMLPGDFQATPFSFRVLNVSVSLPRSTLTTQLNPTNVIHILYMTFVLEQTWCPAFQASGGIMPSSLFVRSMPRSQSWLRCSLSTCSPSLKENAECGIQKQFQAQLSARQVPNMLADKHHWCLCAPSSSGRDGMVLMQFLAWIFSGWVRTTQSLGFKESKQLHILPEQY